jgi:hypothetical protein
MKRPGDGWTKINWHICPECGKKGYYWKLNGTGKDWFCKYCRTYGHKPQEYFIAVDVANGRDWSSMTTFKKHPDGTIEILK